MQIEGRGFEEVFLVDEFDEFLAPSEAEVAALKKQIEGMMAKTQAEMDAAEEGMLSF